MPGNTRLRTALAFSVAGHLVALTLLGLWHTSVSEGERSIDAPVLRVVRLAPRPRVILHRAAAPIVAITRPSPVPLPHVVPLALPAATNASGKTTARWTPHTRPQTQHEPQPVHAVAANEARPEIVAYAESIAPVPVIAATPVPTQPPATPAPTPSAPARIALGAGPYGADYPPMLVPPDVATAVRAELGAHATIRVTVNADGHATAVVFVRFPGDAATRDRLRNELLAARYDPGECDGLKCEKTLEIST